MRHSGKMIRLLGGLVLLAGCYPSYAEVGYGPRYYGRAVEIYDYSPDYYGDWRYSYRGWSPAYLYEYRGYYYPRSFSGARRLQVYRNRSGYFLPPRDRDWSRTDRRFNSRNRPNSSDYGRALRREGRPRRP